MAGDPQVERTKFLRFSDWSSRQLFIESPHLFTLTPRLTCHFVPSSLGTLNPSYNERGEDPEWATNKVRSESKGGIFLLFCCSGLVTRSKFVSL